MWIPDDRNLYKLLTDWGGIFGGIFALIAGLLAYRAGQNQVNATLQAARDQITEGKNKDRAQARALAVAIYPEILFVKVSMERIVGIINLNFASKNIEANIFNLAFVNEDVLLELKISEPPLIKKNGHRLFIMEKAGATIFQLLGVILQYNRLVETLAVQVKNGAISLDDLTGHLTTMESLVALAEQQITPLHDQV